MKISDICLPDIGASWSDEADNIAEQNVQIPAGIEGFLGAREYAMLQLAIFYGMRGTRGDDGMVAWLPEDVEHDEIAVAHLVPKEPRTVLGVHVGMNGTICQKLLDVDVLIRHQHKDVYVFREGIIDDLEGTVDPRQIINGFEAPEGLQNGYDFRMIVDATKVTPRDLQEFDGYLGTVPAKGEDFVMLSRPELCRGVILAPRSVVQHPGNNGRRYLQRAMTDGDSILRRYCDVPDSLGCELEGLTPFALGYRERLFIPPDTPHFGIRAEGCKGRLLLEEVSAPPNSILTIDGKTIHVKGSADLTTDAFAIMLSGRTDLTVYRPPVIDAGIKG